VLLPSGGKCIFLPIPRLDISASSVRAHWLLGRAIHGLVPESVRLLLLARSETVRRVWTEEAARRPSPLPRRAGFSA
jgi:nicotinate-nucleotide adenylyltransferase